MYELHHLVVEVDNAAVVGDVIADDLVARGRDVGGAAHVLGDGGVVQSAALLFAAVVGKHHSLAYGIEHGRVPLDRLGALVDPHLDEVAVALAACVAGKFVEEHARVGLDARVLDELGVHGAHVLTRFRNDGKLLGEEEVKPHVKGGCRACQACGAGAHDEQRGLRGVGDVGLGNLGFGAEPAGRDGGCGGGGLLGEGDARQSTGSQGGAARALDERATIESHGGSFLIWVVQCDWVVALHGPRRYNALRMMLAFPLRRDRPRWVAGRARGWEDGSFCPALLGW